MENFTIIVNGEEQLTVVVKLSILDVGGCLGYAFSKAVIYCSSKTIPVFNCSKFPCDFL